MRKKTRYTLAQLKRDQADSAWLTRDGLVKALKAIRKYKVCGYVGNQCDCKFGFHTNLTPKWQLAQNFRGPDPDTLVEHIDLTSEQTGCPELYTLIDLLESMPKADFDKLVVKARTK